MNKILYSHKTDHWATPKWLYEKYMDNGFIDPCPLHSKFNNLGMLYKNKKLFINPPYSEINLWTQFIKNNYIQKNICQSNK